VEFVRSARSKVFAGALLLALGSVLVGCGGSDLGSRKLGVGDIGWDENVVIANPTKVPLEDEIGYENVELRTLDVDSLYQGVGNGELDAFQDVWLPAHEDYVGEIEKVAELLGSWFRGTTRFGLGALSYVNITGIDQINGTDAEHIFGIEPGAVSMSKIPEDVLPAYGLEQKLVEASTPGMLAEVENRYNSGEDFVFIAWSPHWMNQRYDFTYLDNPRGAFEEVDDEATLTTLVNKDLSEEDPVAYAFLDVLAFDEEQVNDLENRINDLGDPLEGARRWAEKNPDAVEPWLEAAQNARR
jgi:glycine betaine/proline transport system substrate-binding protein